MDEWTVFRLKVVSWLGGAVKLEVGRVKDMDGTVHKYGGYIKWEEVREILSKCRSRLENSD